MSAIFISYSRKDIEFVRQLHDALVAEKYDVWVDWEDIPLSSEWLAEIYAGIEQADAFISVLSPEYLVSANCTKEVVHAVQHNKRLIPIVRRDVIASQVPPSLANLNWIFFHESDAFASQYKDLAAAINLDIDYVHTHTRLLVRAIEWDGKQRDTSFLLRGKDLQIAEEWQATIGKEPRLTDLQSEFIRASRKFVTRQKQILLALLTIGILLVSVLAIRNTSLWQQALGSPLIEIPESVAVIGFPIKDPEEEFTFLAYNKTQPVHRFGIEPYEATNARYKACVDANICSPPSVSQSQYTDPGLANYPVINVTAIQANQFCRWLGRRLPSDIEWERAARGTQGFDWPWGNDQPSPQRANLGYKPGTPGQFATPMLQLVGQYPEGKSAEGVFDLAGNVWEWTRTPYNLNEPEWLDGSNDPPKSLSVRGGDYHILIGSTIAIRQSQPSNQPDRWTGFRCVAD